MTTIGTDPDFRAEQSAERLSSRFDGLKRRFNQAKLKLDVRSYISENPWRAIAIGAIAGVLVGSLGGGQPAKRRQREPERGRLSEAAIAGLSALGMTLLKELASSQLKSLFEKWQGRQPQQPATPYAG